MSVEKIVINNAVKIFLGIVLFFFLMKLIGLDEFTELRILNFAFVFWGVNTAIKQNRKTQENSMYLHNLFIGFFTSFVSVIMVCIALTVYLYYIEPSFIQVLENSSLWGTSLTPPLMAFALFIEGVASSMICTFILMQYWKNKKSWAPKST
jgi:hypothetical protein|tara:strand:+ start:1918 stop:2370 length:453 start_codon:yes stop_codon:yes gene_type:complete